jgi:hypothetical protein
MTDFIQLAADKYGTVFTSLHAGGWLEVDSIDDLDFYESLDLNEYLNEDL